MRKLTIVLVLMVSMMLMAGCIGGGGQRATYSEEYIKEHTGKVVFEVPEAFELANIIVAITDYGLNDPYRVWKHGEYYDAVLEQFLPYKEHELIKMIEFADDGDQTFINYYNFRTNSLGYRLVGDQVEPSEIYHMAKLDKKLEKLVEDFVQVTGFREFYQEQQPFYQELIEEYQKLVPMQQMWDWLEAKFPRRYDSYKVVFSPLIYATHNTRRFTQDDYRECIMFMSGPNSSRISDPVLRSAFLSRAVFTEIDHNYVNPVTDEYRDQVEEALGNYADWNDQGGQGFYRSAYATFNEYVTWGTFLLYANDHYEAEVYRQVEEAVVYQMEKSRKFHRFGDFYRFFLELYHLEGEEKMISELYPEIIEWFVVNGSV